MGDKKAGREGFSSGVAVFFATLGSAVGLGNIWKFPYMTGSGGGGAFLLVYLICVFLVGIPVMVGEFYIGRKSGRNAVGAFSVLCGRTTGWSSIGVIGVCASVMIMFFYTCVAGWVYFYFFKSLTGAFDGVTRESAEAIFGSVIGAGTAGESFFSAAVLSPIAWQVLVLCVVGAVISMGVRSGIERVTKTLMPLLFGLIIICDIRALTLPGAMEGIKFLFEVDFSKITPEVILSALGLAFFKLSLGMGIMITYGSYFTKDNNMPYTAARVAVSDLLVSMMAGIAVFPTVFTFALEPGAGPGLLFMTIPLVFSQMPFGNLLLCLFFLLSSFAATTAMISLLEVPSAYLVEERGMSRNKATFVSCLVIGIIGATASMSVDSSSWLGSIKISGKGLFDLYDYVSSNIMLPIGGLLVALFIGYFCRSEALLGELSNGGRLENRSFVSAYRFVIRYISPVLLIIVFLSSIGVI